MIFLQTHSHDPFYNQAFEEMAFECFRDEPVLLLWRNAPAVVVGCYQNICREVRVPLLRRLGIPVVRRMSGGGTVYHDLGNLNYTLLLPQAEAVNYERCLTPVAEALNRLGVPACRDRICDLAVGGRKISGSAQKSAGGRVLHHGTLLYQSDLTVLDEITTGGKNPHIVTKGTASAICPVVNIAEFLPDPPPLEEFARRLREALLPPGSREVEPSAGQLARAESLRNEKYRGWEWTWGKTPAFTYEKTADFDGAPLRIFYRARSGILSELRLESSRVDGTRAAELLDGARLDPEELAQSCRLLAGQRAEELLDCLI